VVDGRAGADGIPHPAAASDLRLLAGVGAGASGRSVRAGDPGAGGGNAYHTAGPLWTDVEPDRVRRRRAGVDARELDL